MEKEQLEQELKQKREKERREIVHNPYSYICNYAESILPFTGKKAFELLSLSPCSLILPDIVLDTGKKERINIHVFFLAFAGSGKSSTCSIFNEFTYFPIEGRSYTPAELEDTIFKEDTFSLIIEDYSTMSSDERINKIIEGITGDEKIIDRHTKTKNIRKKVEAVALLCGVPQDLNYKITSGTLSRTICLAVVHNDEEHTLIGEHIDKSIGGKNRDINKKEIIKEYYRLLQLIQLGLSDENKEEYMNLLKDFGLEEKEYKQITSYYFTPEAKEIMGKEWEYRSSFFRKYVPIDWFREKFDGYRTMASHAFLNYFNREKKDGLIFPNQDDLIVARKLLKGTMDTKYKLLASEKLARGVRNTTEFNRIMSNEKVPPLVRKMLPIHLKKRNIGV